MKCVCLIAGVVCALADVGLKIDQNIAASEFGMLAQEPLRVAASSVPSKGVMPVTVAKPAMSVAKPLAKSLAKPPAKAAEMPATWLAMKPAAKPVASLGVFPATLAAPRAHSKEAIAAAVRHKSGVHPSHKDVLPSQEAIAEAAHKDAQPPKTHTAQAIAEAARHKAVIDEVPQPAQAVVHSFGHSSNSIASAAQHKKMMDEKHRARAKVDEMTREFSPGVARALLKVLEPIEAPSFAQVPVAQTAGTGVDLGQKAGEQEKEKERRAAIHKGAMKKERAAARQSRREARAAAAAQEVKLAEVVKKADAFAEAVKKADVPTTPAPLKKALTKKTRKHFKSRDHPHAFSRFLMPLAKKDINAALPIPLKTAVAKK